VQALTVYVAHQVEVVTRRSEFRLAKARDRSHVLEGLLKALDMIDAVVKAIRASADRSAARDALMGKQFGFSEIQANHILDMALGRLTRLGRDELAFWNIDMRNVAEPARLQVWIAHDSGSGTPAEVTIGE